MEMKTGKYNEFIILVQKDERGNDIHVVYYKYIRICQFNPQSTAERRLAAIDLVELKYCSRKVAGCICGFSRNTVSKLINIKKIYGIEGVIKENRGLKSPYKYVKKVRAQILKLLENNPHWTDQEIADQAAKDLETDVSRSAVARIRTENSQPTDPYYNLNLKEAEALADIVDRIDKKQYDHKQLELNFNFDTDIKETVSECKDETPFDPQTKNDENLISRLNEGMRFNFAGALMHHLFLQEMRIDFLSKIYPIRKGTIYEPVDIMMALYQSNVIGLPSIESLKLVNVHEFGILCGMNRSPEKETIRDHLSQMGEQNLSGTLIDQIAHALLNQGFIDTNVFFIDGHFLPYYGLHAIAKGYYTVRRLAMPGNELYAITDLQGRPLFFITESNEIDFRPIIKMSADRLIAYGIKRPILVFDRGGYGIHFFKELDEKADFVSWAKHVGDKKLAEIADESFTGEIKWEKKTYKVADLGRKVSESLQTAQKEGRTKVNSMDLRMVVIQDESTGKRIAIYTNNRAKEKEEIVIYMLNRWGKSENIFKEMIKRFNLNYHPGYDIKELEKQPLVDNPDVELTRKAIRIITKEVKKLEEENLIMEGKQSKRKDKRRSKKIQENEEKLIEKNKDIKEFKSKLEGLDEKISVVELLKGKKMGRCDLEKKRIYDAMQFMSYNSRELLVEIFRKCYSDKRDVKQVLDLVTSQGGYIKLYGQTLIVVLDRIENEKHNSAAIKLCEELNRKQIKMSGHMNFKLSFHMSKINRTGETSSSSMI